MSRWENWLKGLIAAMISGAATAVSSVIGAQAMGDPLHNKQIGAIAVSGGIMGAVAYLKQSPVPPDDIVVTLAKAHTVTDSVTIGQAKVPSDSDTKKDDQ